MCGIAGIVAPRGLRPAALERMARALDHRGPDATGYLLFRPGERLAVLGSLIGDTHPAQAGPTLGLAHKRLTIIDLSDASTKPIKTDSDGRRALVYNGEIYNYIELREELTRLGHRFKTTGDTEVVLTAYKEWGPDWCSACSSVCGLWPYSTSSVIRSSSRGTASGSSHSSIRLGEGPSTRLGDQGTAHHGELEATAKTRMRCAPSCCSGGRMQPRSRSSAGSSTFRPPTARSSRLIRRQRCDGPDIGHAPLVQRGGYDLPTPQRSSRRAFRMRCGCTRAPIAPWARA